MAVGYQDGVASGRLDARADAHWNGIHDAMLDVRDTSELADFVAEMLDDARERLNSEVQAERRHHASERTVFPAEYWRGVVDGYLAALPVEIRHAWDTRAS